MHRLGILLVALASLFAIAFSGTASAATSGPTREEFSQLKTRVSKLEEMNKSSLERNAKLETRVTAAEANASSAKGRLSTAETTASALAGRVAKLESASVPKEETPVKEPPAEAPHEEAPHEEAPHEEPTRSLNCFPSPHVCGFPDATNTGPEALTVLTPRTGTVNLGAGQTLSNTELVGSVNVTGTGAKIVNSVVRSMGGGGNGTDLVNMGPGATNFTIEHSVIAGNGSKTNAPESNVWNHYADSGFNVIDSYLHGTPDNIEGPANVEGSFISVDAAYPENHSENIYLCNENATVRNSTLYNEHGETSLIFGDCSSNEVIVEGSLLAGGGYTLGANAKSGGKAGTEIIRNNHFARSPDGFFPRVGGYGISYEHGKNVTWTGNVYDDNGAAVPLP
jgi:hypothetical protein